MEQSIVKGGQSIVIGHKNVSGQSNVFGQNAVFVGGQFNVFGQSNVAGHPTPVAIVPPLTCPSSNFDTVFLFSASFFKCTFFFFMIYRFT
jgi:hypothetical protein